MHMERRQFTAGCVGLAAGLALVATRRGAAASGLSQGDAAAGVKAALERGALAAVALLGRPDGFLADPRVRIPLPGVMADAARLLRATGQRRRVDELETAMNRAAELAVPAGQEILVDAVRSVSVGDALAIVRGGDTAVTDWFAGRTREPLGERFLPIVTEATERVSLAERYNAVAGRAASFGLMKAEDANLQQHVTARTLDGLFLVIGEEEKKLRADPVGSGSALLRRVFGR
jgi:hypothetical protein